MGIHNSESTNLSGLMKTHHCGQLRSSDIGTEVILCGWNNKYRDLGGLHFVDIRDKHGLTQLAFDEFKGDFAVLKGLSLESVIMAKGEVRARPDSAINKNMSTGEVEVSVSEFSVLSQAQEVPFLPHGKISATEDLRLKYRYLDLRGEKLQNILSIRSNAMRIAREALYSEGFTEVETPILYKTTPEGARDYIVPSRVHPGKVYALPQSPQTLKQLLMIGNTDKYFQICKCFRDEDLRADRQPEFTQIDIEVSFANQQYLKNLSTKIVKDLFKLDKNFEIPVMSYQEAMTRYGSDKPDVRFGLEHHVVTELFKGSGFGVFESIIGTGMNKAIFVPARIKEFSRKEVDALVNVVKPHGGQGVAWFKLKGDEVSGGISKFISAEILNELKQKAQVTEDGTFFFCASQKESVAHACADALRRHFGHSLELIKKDDYKFLWVNDFPLLEYDDEEGRFYACHHPFTMPKIERLDDFMSGDKEKLKNLPAEAYDLVCNGYEMGGGSLRIYQADVQEKMFQVLGMGEDEVNLKFGFFVEALKYGTPPHAGIAFGFDRTVMLMAQTDNIRDVISFPKTNAATDLMCSAPSLPDLDQLKELGVSLSKKD
ncbi:MAG: aspartate--tRNA ligase [Bacteriovoracaceae bacterium]|jgi:aspartyl-tRNA synthetase|nr:aspartate--tRNA ligase [Bacteriovoracaceae bacterium]